MSSCFANINPFQTGRFLNDYTSIKQTGDHACTYIADISSNQDCLIFKEKKDGRETSSTIFYTNYTATKINNEEVSITEYKRKLSRMIDIEAYQMDPKSSLATCGGLILSLIDKVLQKYPFEAKCEYWIELQSGIGHSQYPLLVLYVEQQAIFQPIERYCKQNYLSYKDKRKCFIEALSMTFTLLNNRIFGEVIQGYNFVLRVEPQQSSDNDVSCVISISDLFDVILGYVFNTDCKYNDLKIDNNKESRKKQALVDMYNLVLTRVLVELFVEQTSHWLVAYHQLPIEMYMVFIRLSDDIRKFRGDSPKNLVREMKYPFTESRIECFEKLQWLGSGSYGDVHLARHKGSGVKYAIKVIRNYKKSRQDTEKLLAVLRESPNFDHRNIVRCYDAFTSDYHYNWITNVTEADTHYVTSSTTSNGSTSTCLDSSSNENSSIHNEWNSEDRYTFIVLQACKSSLHSLIESNNLSEEECIRYINEFIRGLEHLNYKGFMHRDVKPQNALISESGRLLIADLDTIKKFKDVEDCEDISQTLVMTKVYASPEMRNPARIYNERTDYYSIGITFAQMICPESTKDMNLFLELIHGDRLPNSVRLHPQYAFVICWLTESDPTVRMGSHIFSLLHVLLERHKYQKWSTVVRNRHSAIIQQQKTEEIMHCLRVVNRKRIIREVFKRYVRLPKYNKDVRTFLFRIEPAYEFERNYGFSSTSNRQSCIDLIDDQLVLVNSSANYVYICYSVIISQQYFDNDCAVTSIDVENFIRLVIGKQQNMLTEWSPDTFVNFRTCPFYPDGLMIEPCMLNMVSAECKETQITQFWPPERIFDSAPMSEAGAVFSFGIYIFWNILWVLQVPEANINTAIGQLQRGCRPDQLVLMEPHVSQLILWLCAYVPADRPLLRNITCTFKSDNVAKFIHKERCHRKSVLSISNRPGVMEKVMRKLKICGDFQAIPRRFVNIEYNCDSAKSNFMLDTNENGQLIAAQISSDAVDWLISELGSHYSNINKVNKLERLIFHIHTSFMAALYSLGEFHNKGMYHGNINCDTFLLDRERDTDQNFCLSNPLLIEDDTDLFSRSTYLTEYSSPEQKKSLQGSPKSDVFSLGVTLFAWLCYYHDVHDLNLEMFHKNEKFIFPNVLKSNYCELIRQMTRLNPQERINCEVALEIFNTTCSDYLNETDEYSSDSET